MVDLLNAFVENGKRILGDNLTGVYLHGSAVMGCFNPEKSDIDLIVIVNGDMETRIKRQFMDMTVRLNKYAPAKGIELSIVKAEYCRPFIYPTPFELHFSNAHLDWYERNPEEYVEKMNGTDKDLAAHFTIIRHRGKCLYGKEIREVFGEISRQDYFDSICIDVSEACDEITENSIYIILNLCRVLAFKREGLILSKAEGGDWGLEHLQERYHKLIADSLNAYGMAEPFTGDQKLMEEFADYMLERIF